MLSIITPTYNREKELKRLYKSLVKQSNKDFEWVVVDDGSTDGTEKLLQSFKKEHKLNINYLKKVNGGKPSAYNLGVKKAAGEILLCLDSDDFLITKGVEIILTDYEKIKDNPKIAGLVYNCLDLDNKIIGTHLPHEVIDSYYNIYEKYHVKGDKLQVIKTKIAKSYPFPIIKGEKFITEALINNRISLKYNFLYLDKDLKVVEYLANGYSANYYELVKNNPLGNALYFKELYNYKKSFYNVYGYILFSIYGKIKFKTIFKEHRGKVKILLLYLPVLIIAKLR